MKKSILSIALLASFNVNAAIIGFENGDFENYNVIAQTFEHITASTTTTGPAGWVVGTINENNDPQFLEIRNNLVGVAQSGSNFAELNPNAQSSISQQFSVDASTTEGSLSWYYAPRNRLADFNDYQVTITDGTSEIYNASFDGSAIGAPEEWTFVQSGPLSFVTGATYTLQFASLGNGSDLGANIDNIQLSAGAAVAAVPEPETYAMFLAGLGLLGFASRKRKA